MSFHRFPSFNFPYTSSEDLRQYLIDYGRTGAVHVFKDGKNIECISQKKEINEGGKVRLISDKLTLPLNLPGKISPELNNDIKIEKLQRCRLLHNEEQVTNLISDYGDVVFGEIADCVGTEAAELSWCFKPFNLTTATKFDPILKSLKTDFCEIPADMLTECFEKSREDEKLISLGKYYGNCLGYSRSTMTNECDVVLAYPGGPDMSDLCFTHLEINHEHNNGGSVRLSETTGSYRLPETICQVNMINDSEVIAVRTDHQCWFFTSDTSEGFEKPIFLGNLRCKTKPCSVAVNPHITEEVIVSMETGSLWLWDAEISSVQIVRQCSTCTSEEFDSYFCEFGSHPREVVRGNKTNVELIDLRGSLSTGQDLMTLPSSHFFSDDNFTAIHHYHDNPYHYFLATTQSLVIMDARFPQNPVLKWSHSLEYPVKTINVLPNPSSDDTMVFVGTYENHHVHCFQYCYGENWSTPLAMSSILPPRSTSNPWKISSYNEWPEMVDYPNKAQSYPKVMERVNHPLLGLSCIPNSTTQSLVVLQLSSAGDLFCQNLFPYESQLKQVRDEGTVRYFEELDLDLTASGGCGSKKPNLGKKDEEFITSWVECLIEQTANDLCEKLTENCEDVGNVRHKIFSSFEMDVQCHLCSERPLVKTSKTSAKESDDNSNSSEIKESDICPYCNLSSRLSHQMYMISESDRKILTKESLGLNYEPKSLQMFDENTPCSEPLGIALLNNWYSNEQKPIDLTEEMDTENPRTVKTVLQKLQENKESPAKNTEEFPENVQSPKNDLQPPSRYRNNIYSLFENKSRNVQSPSKKINYDNVNYSPNRDRNEDESRNDNEESLNRICMRTTKSEHIVLNEEHLFSPNVKKPRKLLNETNSPQLVKSLKEKINVNNVDCSDLKGDKKTEDRTPSKKSPRNLPPSGNQSRTPTKTKISRIAGF